MGKTKKTADEKLISGVLSDPESIIKLITEIVDELFPEPLFRFAVTGLIAGKLARRADRLFQRIPFEDLQELHEAQKMKTAEEAGECSAEEDRQIRERCIGKWKAKAGK